MVGDIGLECEGLATDLATKLLRLHCRTFSLVINRNVRLELLVASVFSITLKIEMSACH